MIGEIKITVDLVEVIPMLTGLMVTASVLLAGPLSSPRKRMAAWVLGISSQFLLLGFGWLVGYEGFTVHVLVAMAFAVNIYLTRKRTASVAPSQCGDVAST